MKGENYLLLNNSQISTPGSLYVQLLFSPSRVGGENEIPG